MDSEIATSKHHLARIADEKSHLVESLESIAQDLRGTVTERLQLQEEIAAVQVTISEIQRERQDVDCNCSSSELDCPMDVEVESAIQKRRRLQDSLRSLRDEERFVHTKIAVVQSLLLSHIVSSISSVLASVKDSISKTALEEALACQERIRQLASRIEILECSMEKTSSEQQVLLSKRYVPTEQSF